MLKKCDFLSYSKKKKKKEKLQLVCNYKKALKIDLKLNYLI